MLFYDTIEPGTLGLLRKFQSKEFFKVCRLVGGTSLALQYGHRKSVDLDFFGSFIAEGLQIREVLKTIGSFQVIQESRFIFQYIVEGVKVDFVNYPYKWIDVELKEDSLCLATPKDIAAMKLSAITNRGTKKDFIDLYELLGHFTLKEILGFYQEKYADGVPFLTLKSLTWFEDAEADPMPFMLRDYTWEDVKLRILEEVMRLG
ncbi:MAG: nucleotidyl transferase AbiEii/AbiGii toxin family protein [Fibrobacteraceae bacterium]|nr:nucleotidyl transferase AbiEii/AbiGii toxin family protein [Fibrobacteraceae bacterium]